MEHPCSESGAMGGTVSLIDAPSMVKTRNNLGTLNGCYIPCLLNILGAVLFLRVGFSVGTLGVWGSLGIFAFAEFIAYLTITSFSAIVTNGMMEGGGAYYMISRNLGPAFGGSSGLLFWFTYCINVTFNTVAFTGTIQPAIFPSDSWIGSGDYWSSVLISTVTLFLLYLIAYKGAGAFAKVNYFIFAALVVACAVSIGSLYFNWDTKHLEKWTDTESNDHYYNATFSKFSIDNLRENQWPNSTSTEQCQQAAMFGSGSKDDQPCNLNIVFSIVFPAVVGMMEGANLSGDLKDPAYSIPVGTWAAVSTAFGCYILLIIGQAGTMSREALQFDMNVMQHSTVGDGWFVITGVTAACLSTALGSMFGSARILQAIAKDRIFPRTEFFAAGTMKGDEPRRGVTLSYFIAQMGIFLGNLDDVAPILTNFFLCTYTLVNLACFLLVISNCPNFRPTYKFYHWISSLLGAIMIMVVMFYLQWIYAVITLAIVLALFLYITFFFKESHLWIDITQALSFRVGRACLLKIAKQTKLDPKFWRPNLMLLALDNGSEEDATAHLAQSVKTLDAVKHSGLLVVGYPIIGDTLNVEALESHSARLEEATEGTEAFTQTVVASSVRIGCQNLLVATGLGQMAPNTLVAPLQVLNHVKADNRFPDPEEFVDLMHDAKALHKNIVLTSNGFNAAQEELFIDCWVFGQIQPPDDDYSSKHLDATPEEVQLSLMLQLCYLDVLASKGHAGCCGQAPRFRLVQLAEGSDVNSLNRWLKRARIPDPEIHVVQPSQQASKVRYSGDWSWMADGACVTAVRDHIQAESTNSRRVFMMLNHPSATTSTSNEYMSQLSSLTAGLPPCMMCYNGEGYPIIPNTI